MEKTLEEVNKTIEYLKENGGVAGVLRVSHFFPISARMSKYAKIKQRHLSQIDRAWWNPYGPTIKKIREEIAAGESVRIVAGETTALIEFNFVRRYVIPLSAHNPTFLQNLCKRLRYR